MPKTRRSVKFFPSHPFFKLTFNMIPSILQSLELFLVFGLGFEFGQELCLGLQLHPKRQLGFEALGTADLGLSAWAWWLEAARALTSTRADLQKAHGAGHCVPR